MRLSPWPGVLHSIGLANGFRFRGHLHQFNALLHSWSEACSRSSTEQVVDRIGGSLVAVGNTAFKPGDASPQEYLNGAIQGFGAGLPDRQRASMQVARNQKGEQRMPTTGNPAKPKATKPRTFWWSFVAFLLMVVVVGGVLFSPVLDSIAVESVRCVVVSAEPRTASGGSRGSVSTPEVLIETSNCGPLVISSGVTFDGRQELASSFEVGAEYEFEIGWYSRVIMKDVLHEIQAVQGYRLVE